MDFNACYLITGDVLQLSSNEQLGITFLQVLGDY